MKCPTGGVVEGGRRTKSDAHEMQVRIQPVHIRPAKAWGREVEHLASFLFPGSLVTLSPCAKLSTLNTVLDTHPRARPTD